MYLKCKRRKQTSLNLPKRACSGQRVPQCRHRQELVVSKVQFRCRLRQTAADNHYGSQSEVCFIKDSSGTAQLTTISGSAGSSNSFLSWATFLWVWLFFLSRRQCTSIASLGNAALWRPKFNMKVFLLRSLGMINSLWWDLCLRLLSQQMLGKNLCMPLTTQPPWKSWDTAVNSFLEFVKRLQAILLPSATSWLHGVKTIDITRETQPTKALALQTSAIGRCLMQTASSGCKVHLHESRWTCVSNSPIHWGNGNEIGLMSDPWMTMTKAFWVSDWGGAKQELAVTAAHFCIQLGVRKPCNTHSPRGVQQEHAALRVSRDACCLCHIAVSLMSM